VNKSKKMVVTVLKVLIIITLSISLVNRKIYGTWNVFRCPNRVTYGGNRYDKGIVFTFTDKEKPKYEVSSMIDKLTGKRVYSKTSDYLGCGKTVFLYLGGNEYLGFGTGGGG